MQFLGARLDKHRSLDGLLGWVGGSVANQLPVGIVYGIGAEYCYPRHFAQPATLMGLCGDACLVAKLITGVKGCRFAGESAMWYARLCIQNSRTHAASNVVCACRSSWWQWKGGNKTNASKGDKIKAITRWKKVRGRQPRDEDKPRVT